MGGTTCTSCCCASSARIASTSTRESMGWKWVNRSWSLARFCLSISWISWSEATQITFRTISSLHWWFCPSSHRHLPCSISTVIQRKCSWAIHSPTLQVWHLLQWGFLVILASRCSSSSFLNCWTSSCLFLSCFDWFLVHDTDFLRMFLSGWMSRIDSETRKLKPSVISSDPKSPYYNRINLTLINVCLYFFGPLSEKALTRVLLGFQFLCSLVAVILRYQLGRLFRFDSSVLVEHWFVLWLVFLKP